MSVMEATVNPLSPGSRLDADHPKNGVLIPCRFTQLQLAHDLAQVVQRRIGVAVPAQDHEVVGIDHEPTAQALLQSELLPPQNKPAHIDIRQQR
jgi:hypothetical protein